MGNMATSPATATTEPASSTPTGNDSQQAKRYVCVHGHFYQPPRENPWLETVEVQDSAAPYHDWNERITSECYAPNGASRITNKKNEITRILNNYARMSFNFGPTLLSWLADFAPRTYRMIQDADRSSAARYSGHGSALAQVYNHIIMPLASERDARTQIRWGIADFEHRFGRKPEGMWLAETAVSRSVLDLMAQEGILFTVLAPHQCARVRKLSDAEINRRRDEAVTDGASRNSDKSVRTAPSTTPWDETPNATVDTTQPYLVKLNSGRSIAVFFYDGPASRAIAFEGLLNSGEAFARRLVAGLHDSKSAPRPQLAHVATDGESYGHHHKHGEMALSYAMHSIEEQGLATLTNYGEFLAKFPPTYEAEVVDNSSWSCVHGVERWRSNCGCNGGKPGWNQEWRGPLREALDLLRDRTAPLAEEVAAGLFKNLWKARDSYIKVVLNRRADMLDHFFRKHATHELTPAERVVALELMELQRHAQLMYTSCGWFFDEISGIETVQVIAYAGRVLQLARKLFGQAGDKLEADFLDVLSRARSNLPDIGDGAKVYRRHVIGAQLDLEHVGAHYAISSMFRSYPDSGQLFCFDVRRHSYDLLTSGRGRFALGRASLRSRITEETEEICFAVLHLGDQNLSAAVKRFGPQDEKAWADFAEIARASIRRANLPDLIRQIDSFFGGTVYSLTSLFADEQHRILTSILNQTLSEVESSLMRIYEEHATLLDFLSESNVAAPPALALAASFAINAGLRHALEAETYDAAEVARLLRRAEFDNVALDVPLLSYTADRRMKRAMVRLEGAVEQQNLRVLHETVAIAESIRSLPMDVNLWQAQNIWNDLLRRGSDNRYWSREWRDGFRALGLALNILVDELVVEEGVRTF
jgi:alpha-amylase/alpha-mannosidase (GH57 family)